MNLLLSGEWEIGENRVYNRTAVVPGLAGDPTKLIVSQTIVGGTEGLNRRRSGLAPPVELIFIRLVHVCIQEGLTMQQVVHYVPVSGAEQSAVYAVLVNGEPVLTERYKDIHYARFSFQGKVEVRIESALALGQAVISPLSCGLVPRVTESTMTFTLEEPRKLILHGGGVEKLFLFADPVETDAPEPDGPNVIDASTYITDASQLQTTRLQQAIDDAAGIPGGGTVYFSNGLYRTGSLFIKSGVTLYLESGALLQGSDDPGHYPSLYGTWGAMLYFDGVEHANVYGRGIIDGNGRAVRNRNDAAAIRLVRTKESGHIAFRDVYFRDSARWSFHLVHSEHITLKDVKLINDLTVSNTDGVDPDSSRHITVDGMFQYTGDDTIAIKTTGHMQLLRPTEHVTVRNCVFWNIKSSLKVGTETKSNISDITFENNDVVHADRALALYMNDGAVIERIRFVDNRAEEIGGDNAERLIIFKIGSRNGIGVIQDVLLRNFTAHRFSPNASLIQGFDDAHEIRDVTFDNIVLEGRKRLTPDEARMTIRHAGGITFR